MHLFLSAVIKLFKQASNHLNTNNGFDSAAVLAFSTLFAIIPTLTLALNVFSLSSYVVDLQKYLDGFWLKIFLPDSLERVSAYIDQFINSAQQLRGMSLLFLLLAAVFLFRQVDNRISSMWPLKKSRHFGIDLIVYLLVLVLGPLFLALSLLLSSYLSASDLFAFVPIGGVLISGLPIILSVIGLSLLYYFIPSEKIAFKNAIKSGFIVAFLLEVLKLVLLIYIAYFPVYELIYGALSIILLFMLWVYFSWILVLFGASMSYCLEKK